MEMSTLITLYYLDNSAALSVAILLTVIKYKATVCMIKIF